ncbi:GGDEF domain-containing protein [Actinoplanes rectilineatus]|uniref:GGDEF domain-containing protein n=1 Tax=Actinoplanes rectilineatus TaxID=113571 RepID=UPI000A5AD82F|nr:GGDEF domain-containing protein [Actinoplanes rectilineatus]
MIGVLRWLVLGLSLSFAVMHLARLYPVTPQWVTAGLILGVYGGATLLVLLRALRHPVRAVAWRWMAAGLFCYTAGTTYSWIHTWNGAILPFPSPSDILWLSFYPLAYIGSLEFLRERDTPRRTLLDGAIAGLGGATVFSAFVVDLLIDPAGTGGLANYVALAYPLGDSLLVGTLLARAALGSWTGAPSALIMAGFTTFIAADTGYIYQVSHGSYDPGSIVNLLYVLGLAMIGQAAWQHPTPVRPALDDHHRLGASVIFAWATLVILLLGNRVRLSALTVGLAGLSLIMVVLRTMVSIRELEAVSRARHLEARRDALTGLANRRAVMEHLDGLLDRPDPPPIALLLMDLNRFKFVNDTYGHQVGDRLLEAASERLQQTTRAEDVLARLGGDEFVVVLAGPQVAEPAAAGLATRIRERLSGLFHIEGLDIEIDVSIGIALRSGDDDANLLLQHADIAMYEAKRAGGGHMIFHRRLLDVPPSIDTPAPAAPPSPSPASSSPA